MDVIVHKSCPYSKQYLHDSMNVGFAPEFQLKMPMERVKAHIQDPEEFDRIASKINTSLWPWQAKCACGRIRDKIELESNGGQCEHCRQDKEHENA